MSSGELPEIQNSINAGRSEALSLPVTVGSFLLAFAAACIVFLVIGHFSMGSPRRLWPFDDRARLDRIEGEPISEPFAVPSVGIYKKALGGERLNPIPGRDYTVFSWFKLRRLPADGESYGLVGKFDAQVPNRPGYAVSLEGAPDGVRPRVYASAATGGGRWYSFSVYPISRRYWYLLSVSFTDDSFLSAHIIQAGSGEEPTLLGGHRLGLPSLPFSASDMVVGAFGASRFRGQIGPFGILSQKKLRQDLPSYLKAISLEPNRIPRLVDGDSIELWASPAVDLGPKRYEVITMDKPDKAMGVPAVKKAKAAPDKKTSARSSKKVSSKSSKSARPESRTAK
jgi:hypothetical protein